MLNPDLWTVCLRANPHARMRLLCFPYAGSGANAYRPWSARLPEWIEPWAVLYPGRETRWAETALTDAAALARGIAAAIKVFPAEIPFSFFGHSLGAILSFEAARILEAGKQTLPARLIISGRRAPSIAGAGPRLSTLPDSEFFERLAQLNGTPPEVLAHEELMSLLAPTLRADFSVDEAYVPVDTCLGIPMSIYGGRSDGYVSYAHLSAWASHTTGASTIHVFAGDHFYFKDPTTPMFAVLAEELLNSLQP